MKAKISSKWSLKFFTVSASGQAKSVNDGGSDSAEDRTADDRTTSRAQRWVFEQQLSKLPMDIQKKYNDLKDPAVKLISWQAAAAEPIHQCLCTSPCEVDGQAQAQGEHGGRDHRAQHRARR